MSDCNELPELPISQHPVGSYYLQEVGDGCKVVWMRLCQGTDNDWMALGAECVVCGKGEPDADELADYPTGSYYVDTSDDCNPHVWVKLDACGFDWFNLCKGRDAARMANFDLMFPINDQAETPVPFSDDGLATTNTNPDKFEFTDDGKICVLCDGLIGDVHLSFETQDLTEDDCRMTIGIDINGAFAGREVITSTGNTTFPATAPIFTLPAQEFSAGDKIGGFAFASDGKELMLVSGYVSIVEVG